MRYKHHDSPFLLHRELQERPCIRQAKVPYRSNPRKCDKYFEFSVMCKRKGVIIAHSHLLELMSCALYSRCESDYRPKITSHGESRSYQWGIYGGAEA